MLMTNLYYKLVQVSCKFCQILMQVHRSSCVRNFHNKQSQQSDLSILLMTGSQENYVRKARTLLLLTIFTFLNFGHLPASFWHGIAVFYLVQENCTRKILYQKLRLSWFLVQDFFF